MNEIPLVGFENLHCHSFYSLDGVNSPAELCDRVVANGQSYLSISDHGNLSSIPHQIRACEEKNIQPIFAIEAYINKHQKKAGSLEKNHEIIENLSEEEKKEFKVSPHLLLIAYNQEGYKNLVRMSSWSFCYGFYRHPRINYEILKEHKEGIIATSACINSPIGRAFLKGGEEAAKEEIKEFISIFGKENFYLEIMLLDFKKQRPYNEFLIKAAEEFGLKIIISCDAHYADKEESHMQKLILLLKNKKTLADLEDMIANSGGTEDIFELQDTNLYLKDERTLNETYKKHDYIPFEVFQEAKKNTLAICERAKGVKLDRKLKLPQIPDADQKLQELVVRGMKEKNNGLYRQKKYAKRLSEELDLIKRKGFSSYFLIQKMIRDGARAYAKTIGIDPAYVMGKGRGSAGGALVLYFLGVTDVDPIKEDLLFSRFLSESRGGRSLNLEFKNIDPLPPEEMLSKD